MYLGSVFSGLPGWFSVNPPANAGDVGDADWIPGSGSSFGEGNGNSLQCFCLENPMDRGTSWATLDSKRVRHDLLTKQQQIYIKCISLIILSMLHSIRLTSIF